MRYKNKKAKELSLRLHKINPKATKERLGDYLSHPPPSTEGG